MNMLKVIAVVIGAIIVFAVLGEVVSVLMGLLSVLLFVALVGGGGYVVYKLMGGGRRREIRRGGRY